MLGLLSHSNKLEGCKLSQEYQILIIFPEFLVYLILLLFINVSACVFILQLLKELRSYSYFWLAASPGIHFIFLKIYIILEMEFQPLVYSPNACDDQSSAGARTWELS